MNGTWKWKLAQFVELKWWQWYLRNKKTDEYLKWKKQYWKDILKKCAHDVSWSKDAEILDAGSGPAGMFMALEDYSVAAFDPLIPEYEARLQHFKKEWYPHVRFAVSTLEAFKNDPIFDVVFCMNALNHVSDLESSTNNLIAALKPGGILILTIDAHTHTSFKKIFRAIPGDILHPQQLDLNEYQNLFLQRGCKLVATELLKHSFFFDHYLLIFRRSG